MAQSGSGKGGGSKDKGSGSKGKDVMVQPNGEGRWEVKKVGHDRASKVTDTKKEAESYGRDQARKEGSELVVKGLDGQIQRKDSHGHDPNPPKDRR